MNELIECMRCHTHMEAGFLLDGTQAGFQQEKWSPGEPVPSFWMGLKLKADSVIPVRTFRCPRCGYLESYAIQESAGR